MEAVIVSTTIASVMLLFASDNDPDTFKVPTLAVARVELLTVVVVKVVEPLKELVPVKTLLFARYANEEVPASWLTERPVTAAPADRLKAVATVNVPRLAVVIVELVMVVVVKVLVPVKLLLPDKVARVEVPLKLLNARPVIDEPVKLMLPFCTDKLVEVTLLIVPFVPAKLVKKPLVDVTEVPVAVVKPNAPDNVPPVSSK